MMGRGGGRGGGGRRDRPQVAVGRGGGGYSPRLDERERSTGWDVVPTSRNLWVGNLSPHVTESLLSEKFLRFGDLESISHIPGRSYTFVNFVKEEDAAIALRGLQGSSLAGSQLKIEFAKGGLGSVMYAAFPPQVEMLFRRLKTVNARLQWRNLTDRAPVSHDEEHLAYHGERYSTEREEPFSHGDSRPQRPSSERSVEKSRGDKSSEPSEMLWIGFPSFLNVDEMVLRRAFSPFGEIEKITSFPVRNYAFVQYRSVVAACRAKEALQGRLFNNPRVNICFAKSDRPPTEHSRSFTDSAIPLHARSNFSPGLRGHGESLQRERSFDGPVGQFHMVSPGLMPNVDRMPGDTSIMGFSRNSSARAGPGQNFGGTFDHVRLPEVSPERRTLEDAYERRGVPAIERGMPWHDFPLERHKRSPLFDDSWCEEDASFPLSKKMKTESFLDKELPEYPFADMDRDKRGAGMSKLHPGFAEQHLSYNKFFDPVSFGYKEITDHRTNITHSHSETEDSWRMSDPFHSGPLSLPSNAAKLPRVTPEPCQPPLSDEWKWEGTIAKGGTPVCRARCFPVGKVLDFMLPEFLNCTARTGLDMLAKHYYQAANTCVVFFVPETDADIVFYNEFMHYLGEKQRAAVAKLGEKISLFLVPPSDFSEQVLKVPGKVSISGVILQFQQPSSNFNSFNNPLETMESKPPPVNHGQTGVRFHEEMPFPTQSSPEFRPLSHVQNFYHSSSGIPVSTTDTFLPLQKHGENLSNFGPTLPMEKVPGFHQDVRPDQFQPHNHVLQSNWSSHMHTNASGQSFPPAPNVASHSFDNLMEQYTVANSGVVQGTSSNYTPESSGFPLSPNSPPLKQETKHQVSSASPISLQPEQLAQLAALLGQHKQYGKETALSTDGSNQLSSLLQGSRVLSQASMPFDSTGPHSGQIQQLQQHLSTVSTSPFTQMQQSQQHKTTVSAAHFSQPQQLQQPSSVSAFQSSQVQQFQQPASNVSTVQSVGNLGHRGSQQAANSTQEEFEADPQKRLQATLQLAAALLQQIQQQAKTSDQK